VGRMCERSDLDILFSEAIDEVRRKIVARRLTSELNARQMKNALGSGRRQEFSTTESMDNSLGMLVELAKDKVKISDFT
jgi:hypothetical protein